MPIMLVAASGGHLAQLDALAPRIPGYDEDALWVTFDCAQSRSLLADRRVQFVRNVPPRGAVPALRAVPAAYRLLRKIRPSLVVSTGNAIAASFLPTAAALGIPSLYIESAARASGPSLTGRSLQYCPGVSLCCQYTDWPHSRWQYIGSVFDSYSVAESRPDAPVETVFVTLGTSRFGYRRLLERLVAIIPAGVEVTWQTGTTDAAGLPITATPHMSQEELDEHMAAADVVIAHAGIGSALSALNAGKLPILVPRRRQYGEHVDDHQEQIATALESRGLALSRTVQTLSFSDLSAAAGRTVERSPESAPMLAAPR